MYKVTVNQMKAFLLVTFLYLYLSLFYFIKMYDLPWHIIYILKFIPYKLPVWPSFLMHQTHNQYTADPFKPHPNQ